MSKELTHAGGIVSEETQGNVTKFKTDQMIADEIREELRPLVAQVCKIMDKGTRAGLLVDFGVTRNQIGLHFCAAIEVKKVL